MTTPCPFKPFFLFARDLIMHETVYFIVPILCQNAFAARNALHKVELAQQRLNARYTQQHCCHTRAPHQA